jgi:hypothetical protein
MQAAGKVQSRIGICGGHGECYDTMEEQMTEREEREARLEAQAREIATLRAALQQRNGH